MLIPCKYWNSLFSFLPPALWSLVELGNYLWLEHSIFPMVFIEIFDTITIALYFLNSGYTHCKLRKDLLVYFLNDFYKKKHVWLNLYIFFLKTNIELYHIHGYKIKYFKLNCCSLWFYSILLNNKSRFMF